MTIPREYREGFFKHMRASDDGKLSLRDWLAHMLDAAELFLSTNRIDEEPRAAVVYYCKRLDLGAKADDDGQAGV